MVKQGFCEVSTRKTEAVSAIIFSQKSVFHRRFSRRFSTLSTELSTKTAIFVAFFDRFQHFFAVFSELQGLFNNLWKKLVEN